MSFSNLFSLPAFEPYYLKRYRYIFSNYADVLTKIRYRLFCHTTFVVAVFVRSVCSDTCRKILEAIQNSDVRMFFAKSGGIALPINMVNQKSTMICNRNLLVVLALGLISQGANGFIPSATIRTKKSLVKSIKAVEPLSYDSMRRTNHITCMSLYDDGEGDRRRTELTNKALKASRTSFRHVENNTFRLLDEKPMLAMAIFVGLGLLVMYISGFAVLGGYMSSPNPMENGAVPYWDDDLSNLT